MAAEPKHRDPVDTAVQNGPDARLDATLSAWFETLLAQPVPEALLRYLDQLDGAGDPDQASSA
jgi:hypothetical protein